MEEFPLNKAHREYRRAEAYEKAGSLLKASSSHELAASLLTEAFTYSKSPVIRESLLLQHQYHIRQAHLLKIRLRTTEMAGSLNRGERFGNTVSIGSSTSGASTCIGREASPQPHRQSLLAEIHKTEDKLKELVNRLQKLSTTNYESCSEGLDTSKKTYSESTLSQLSHQSSDNTSEGKDNSMSSKSDVAQRLASSDHVQHTHEEKSVISIIEEIKVAQKLHSQLTCRLVTEIYNLEKENLQLHSQMKDLQVHCNDVERERNKLRDLSPSNFLHDDFSPRPELAPLDLPPLHLPSSPFDNS